MAAVGAVLLLREGAAKDDRCAKEREVALRDVDSLNQFRVVAGEVVAGAAEIVGGDILHHAGLLLPAVKVGGGSDGTFAPAATCA